MTDPRADPIIVGGCHRSGTTLVRRILNAHSRLYCGPEANFFRDFHGDYYNDPIHHARFMTAVRSILPEDELLEVLGRAFVSIHERAAARNGKVRWADKDPANVVYLAEWERLLGGRWRFVHVVRNPLDTIASIKHANFRFVMPADLSSWIAFYCRYTEAGLSFGHAHPDRYYRIVYEQLVTDPEPVLTQLMEWLGERFEAEQLAFNRGGQESGLEDRAIGSTTRIHRQSVGAWRDWISAKDAAQIVESCGLLWREIDPNGQFAALPAVEDLRDPNKPHTLPLVDRVRQTIIEVVPEHAVTMVVSKGDEELLRIDGREAWHFPQAADGSYAGYYPAQSEEAVAQLEASRKRGGQYLVFPRTAFWWLQHYPGLHEYLRERHRLVAERKNTCLIYDLREPDRSAAPQ